MLFATVVTACGARTEMSGVAAGDAGATADAGGGGDAQGDAGCAGEAFDCPWGGCLDGPLAQCFDGHWVCPPPPDHCGGTSVACGDTVCTPDQYCQVASGGPPPLPDSGPTVGYACVPVPSGCANSPTCVCIMQLGACNGGQVVQCTDANGGITLECAFP